MVLKGMNKLLHLLIRDWLNLQVNDIVWTKQLNKAKYLWNDYFRFQTIINDDDVQIPFIVNYPIDFSIDNTILTPLEVETVPISLP